ncbi:hypothetical protein [Methylocystis sp. SB2]|uniref:hypothetical protein n=1 Tax=Methylocystis sp. (strain SB2) TaxID=743836 RepID=UPI0004A39F40|nr:hypothetical protein [Methylocystis sp. SB2]ULO23143.1 hypothetical protein LNB28_13435 [Methylocystis sp. SB2]
MTNRLTVLAGVDGRSARGRRFKDLCIALSAPFGSFEGLSEEEAILVRHAVTMTIAAEEMQLAVANGEMVDNDGLIRTTNALARIMNALKVRHRPKREAASSLAAYLASKAKVVVDD